MNLQIAQLFSAANASLSADVAKSQPEILSQLSSASLQRTSHSQIQISAPQLLASTLLTSTPASSVTVDSAATVISGEKQITLFDMLPVKQITRLTQADTQRLITALADGMTLAALSQSKSGFTLTGTVENIANRTVSLNLQMPGNPGVKLVVPDSIANQLKSGDKVTLKLQPESAHTTLANQVKNSSGQQWTATLSSTALPEKEASFPVPSSSPTVKLAVAKVIASAGITLEQPLSTALQKNLNISPSPSNGKPNTPVSMHIVNVQVRGNQLDVRGTELKPMLNITLPQSSPKLLPVGDDRLVELANQNSIPRQTGKLASIQTNVTTQNVATHPSPLLSAKSDTLPDSVKLADKLSPELGISAEDVPVVLDKVRQLSRQLLAQTGSTNEALTKLVNVLRNPGFDMHAESKAVSKHLLNQLLALQQVTKSTASAGLPQTNVEQVNSDSGKTVESQVRQLIQSPALTSTPSALLSQPAASGFINALVSLLQISLAGRAARAQPDLARIIDKADSVSGKTVSASGGSPSTPQAGRVANDFAQLDSRSNLLEQVRALLANHQQQKMQNVESRLQGQDSLFYILPVANEDQPPPELHIRAEERDSRNNAAERGKQRIWHLTMKLSVGDAGELLAKTKINNDTIELRIYTSSDALLTSVIDTLPYLLRRLESQGLTVEHHSCQRGKIPKTMKDMPYQLFEALA